MDWTLYFNALDKEQLDFFFPETENRIGNKIAIYTEENFPELEDVKIVILGVEESRNANNNIGSAAAPNAIRKQFYRLYFHENMPKIADIGNLKIGQQIGDTYFVLGEIVAKLVENDIIVVILGGSQDLTYGNYLAYQQLNKVINITSIDAKFDIGESEKEIRSDAYINKIILSQPNYLFNYSNIGYQSYFVDNKDIELMNKLYFDAQRLGVSKSDILNCEPIIRNANLVTVDMSAVRFADSPGCPYCSPNGFTGEEICTLAHYAGGSDRLSSFGIYEYNPELDIHNQGAILIAQMLWYFIQGVMLRCNDLPDISKGNFYKYTVSLFNDTYQIVFYKSKTSQLWWMEIPVEEGENVKFNKNYIIPCSIKDYQTACNDEVPERWLQTYKKIK